MNKASLCFWSPDGAARPIAVTESGAVEGNNAIGLCGCIKQTARVKVLNHTSIAVKEDERFPFSSFNVVEPNSINYDKAANWRVTTLSHFCEDAISKSRCNESHDNTGSNRVIFQDRDGM